MLFHWSAGILIALNVLVKFSTRQINFQCAVRTLWMFLKCCSLVKLATCVQVRNGNIERVLNFVKILLNFKDILNLIFKRLFIKFSRYWIIKGRNCAEQLLLFQHFRGADKSLARPDWKNNCKVTIFLSDPEVIAPGRPGWVDNLLVFFEWLTKVRVWSLLLVSFLVGLRTYQHTGIGLWNGVRLGDIISRADWE